MSQPITNEATKQKLLDLLRRDEITRQDAAIRLGCSSATIYKWCCAEGIRVREKHDKAN